MIDGLHEKLLNYLYMRKDQLAKVKISESGLDLVGEAVDIARLAGQTGEIDSMIKYFAGISNTSVSDNNKSDIIA